MNNELPNKPPFKVKCVRCGYEYLTNGKEYDVVEMSIDIYKDKYLKEVLQ